MYMSIRRYSGCLDVGELNRRIGETLIPELRKYPGFISYSVVTFGNDVASISQFETEEQAGSATEKARDLVQRTLADLLPNAPEVTIGEVLSEYR